MDFETIKELRKSRNFTQDQVASMLWVSRVTYNLIENGKTDREPYAEKLEDIFDVSFHALDTREQPASRQPNKTTVEKAQELIMYILDKTAQLPNVGKTVLYKILYFCEFDRYELTGERMTGLDFIKLPRGPAPVGFDAIISDMEKENKIISVSTTYMGYVQQRYMLNEKVTDSPWKGEQKKFIDKMIDRLKDMNAKEISDYSHGDLPRQTTADMWSIDIKLANHRQYPYSAKARKAKYEQDVANITQNPAFAFLLDEEDIYNDLI